jgi:transcription antitermination factor NusG
MESCISLSQPQQRHWFAVYTAPRHEKQVFQHLKLKEVDCFLPLYQAVHNWKTGPARVELPLFPNYLFVHIDESERRKVIELPSVHSIVGNGSKPVRLPDSDIECLRQSMATGCVQPHPYLKVGMQVRVTRGPLEGFEGLLVRTKGAVKVVLSIDLIMKSLAVEVNSSDIEPIQTSQIA